MTINQAPHHRADTRINPIWVADALTQSWRDDPPPWDPDLSQADLGKLFEHLQGTGASSLMYRRIRRCASLQGDDVLAQMQQSYKAQQLRATVQMNAIAELSKLLSDRNILHMVFKGWAVARAYGDPCCRPFGDIDVLVRPHQMAKTLDLLHGMAHQGDVAATGPRDTVIVLNWQFPEALSKVDLHDDLSKFRLPDVDALFQQGENAALFDQHIPVPDMSQHVRLVCLHFLRHGGWRPLWLCDIAALIEAHGADINWPACHGNDPTLINWISVCADLAHTLLGADIDALPNVLKQTPAPEWMQRRVLGNWSKPFSVHNGNADLRYKLKRHPLGVFAEILRRWPDPIRAVTARSDLYTARHPFGAQASTFLRRGYATVMGSTKRANLQEKACKEEKK